jgi:hypothetical protein
MKLLSQIELNQISGGGSDDDTDASTTYTYDDGSTVTYHADGGVSATEADSRAVGAFLGGVTGAVLCTGATIPSGGTSVPLVPLCVTTGAFIGNIVGGSRGSTPSGGVTGGHHYP